MIINTDPYFDSDRPIICYENKVSSAVITSAQTFQPGFPAEAIHTYPTWEGSRPTNPANWIIVVDFGGEVTLDYMAISSVELGNSASISIADFDTLEAIQGLSGQVITAPTLFLLQPFQVSRIGILFQNVNFIGNFMAGRRLTLPHGIYVGHSPANLNRQTVVTGATSETGQYLGRVVRSELVGTSVELQNIDPVWYRQNFDPFVEAARSQPFYWAWRPTTYNETIYGWLDGDVSPSNQRANGMMQVSFNIRGTAR